MPAKMPLVFVAPPDRSVSQLAAGENADITFTDIRVGLDLSTYVARDAKLRQRAIDTVTVTRTNNGYRLEINDASPCFTPAEIADNTGLIPIEDIVVDVGPEPFQGIRSPFP